MTAETIEQETSANGGAPEAEAEKTRHDMFRYASYVHVGEGAKECEHREDGKCEDEGHFHAWVRLPNPFQVRDISEKAKAAQARKVRMLKDPQSDPYVVMEAELDAIKTEASREILVDEILERDFVEDYNAAIRAVREMEDESFVPKDEGDEVPKLYADIEQDQEEFARQTQLAEDQRDETYTELQNTITRYGEHLQAELDKILEPKKARLMERPIEQLVDIIRNDRIENEGNESYLHTYNTWQWFVCTFKPKDKGTPNERVFKDFTQFKYETPSEVVAELQVTFRALEQSLAGDRAKNS